MFFKNKRIFFTLLIFIFSVNHFYGQEIKNVREVSYTAELYEFINMYFNHQIKDEGLLEKYYLNAKESLDQFEDEYHKLVHLARCDYYYGQVLMENYDPSEMATKDLSDTSKDNANSKAASFYDSSIESAKKALKIKEGSDAYSVLAQAISANCTAKNVLYIIANGLSVRKYAKLSQKIDMSNGTAHFLAAAQDIYAPAPFAKIKSGRDNMQTSLADKNVSFEKFDLFNIYSSIAYSYQRQKNKEEAFVWYKKCLELYPDNVSVNNLSNKMQ